MSEEEAGGLSGVAGYFLGRIAAERQQTQAQFREVVRSRFAPRARLPYAAEAVEGAIASWKAAVRSRDVTIEQLRASGAALTAERDQLRACNARLEADAVRMHAANAELQRREALANKLWENAAETGQKDDFDLFLARHEIARLQAQIARLQQDEK